jgi:hypothetical protein
MTPDMSAETWLAPQDALRLVAVADDDLHRLAVERAVRARQRVGAGDALARDLVHHGLLGDEEDVAEEVGVVPVVPYGGEAAPADGIPRLAPAEGRPPQTFRGCRVP